MSSTASIHLLFLSLRLIVLVVLSGHTSLPISIPSHKPSYRTTASVGRVLSELDVLLRIHMNHERRSVHHLLANTDVALLDQHTSVVDRLRKAQLEHTGLQSAVHQLGSRQLQNHIELHLLLRDESQTSHAADDGSSLEDSARIILRKSQQFTSSLRMRSMQKIIPCGSWQAPAAHARSHACSADRTLRKYGAPGPDARARRGDEEC